MISGDTWGLPRLLLLALTLIAVGAIVLAGATSTTAFGTYTQTWEGASELRQLGDTTDTQTTLIRNTTQYPENGTNTLAILLSPAAQYQATDQDRIAAFVRTGGTLLIAEDFRPHSNTLLAALGAESRFDGRLVRDERHYTATPAFPIATNLSAHPLTNDSESLTLNHGTVINPAENASVIARTSEFAYLDTNQNAALDDTERLNAYPVVVIERVGEGRVLLVSDPSIFINSMLERSGNRAFAQAVFQAPDRVLLDTSHTAGGLPPLQLAVLVLRDTPLYAFTLGALAIMSVFLWERGAVPALPWSRTRSVSEVVSPDAIVAGVVSEHPEWDRERVERVVKALMLENEPEQGND